LAGSLNAPRGGRPDRPPPALERRDSTPPQSPSRAKRRGFRHARLGTPWLGASLEIGFGNVEDRTAAGTELPRS
jgi:hypothetical protein